MLLLDLAFALLLLPIQSNKNETPIQTHHTQNMFFFLL